MKKLILILLFLAISINLASANTFPQNGHLTWKGQTWDIRSEHGEPGPCAFNPQGAFIDDQGRLHLTIQKVNGRWKCTEVDTVKKYKYGVFRWTLDSPNFEKWDKNIVGSPFLYKDDLHEIDIEFSRWSSPRFNFIWFANQPYDLPSFQAKTTPQVCEINWTKNRVTYSVWDTTGKMIAYTTTNKGVHSVASNVCLNLWLNEGRAPCNRQPVELIVSDFSYRRN
jgi:hypothetical protein